MKLSIVNNENVVTLDRLVFDQFSNILCAKDEDCRISLAKDDNQTKSENKDDNEDRQISLIKVDKNNNIIDISKINVNPNILDLIVKYIADHESNINQEKKPLGDIVTTKTIEKTFKNPVDIKFFRSIKNDYDSICQLLKLSNKLEMETLKNKIIHLIAMIFKKEINIKTSNHGRALELASLLNKIL